MSASLELPVTKIPRQFHAGFAGASTRRQDQVVNPLCWHTYDNTSGEPTKEAIWLFPNIPTIVLTIILTTRPLIVTPQSVP